MQAYERDPYQTRLDTEILGLGDDGGRPFAVLADTLLYPEGGGQPADRGRLEGPSAQAAVTDVQRLEGAIRHYLEESAAPLEPGPATLHLDWERRFDHMQQHTAQHLLSALAEDRFGWVTTSFHLGPETSDIELAVPSLGASQLETLEQAVAAEIRARRPVTARRVAADELAGLPVRSRGLPEGHRGDVRLVEIEGVDCATCGGTHLASTGEIETVKLLATEPLRGGTRLFWLAGSRVRQRLASDEARLAELRSVLGAADDELASVAALKLDQLKEAGRRERALLGRLAEVVGEGLVSRTEAVVEAHFDGGDPGLLQQVARRFAASEHPGLAFLTASGDKGSFFVVAAGGGGTRDAQTAGRRATEILDGRGGGSGAIFQGKVGSLERRGEVVAALWEEAAE
jgi:Ser-tRNA(Ala) deacylase AlaX